jgi:predicted lipoprotein with Yx(FWY)xxD motif
VRSITILLATGLPLLLAGCGGDDGSPSAEESAAKDEAAMEEEDPMKEEGAATGSTAGTTITVGDSEFGEMLFGSNQRAIYIFQNDPKDESACYGECAEAWPPVLTEGKPEAANRVDASLLGTVKRRDGELQVSYAGQPLYFYANEQPGEVRCHNVNLNGGFWWVVGPDGERRP